MTSEPLNQYTEVCKVTDKHYSRVFLQLGVYLLHGILLAKRIEEHSQCVNEYIILLNLILYDGNVLVYFLKAILYLTDKFVFFCLVRSVKVENVFTKLSPTSRVRKFVQAY